MADLARTSRSMAMISSLMARESMSSDRDPEHLDWSKYGVEIVVEIHRQPV